MIFVYSLCSKIESCSARSAGSSRSRSPLWDLDFLRLGRGELAGWISFGFAKVYTATVNGRIIPKTNETHQTFDRLNDKLRKH